jgi:hypothetical protein
MAAARRLLTIFLNAVIVAGLWYWALTGLDSVEVSDVASRLIIALLFISLFFLSFLLAFSATDWKKAVSRSVFSSCLCVIMFGLFVLLFEGSLDIFVSSEDESAVFIFVFYVVVVGIIAVPVALFARWLGNLLTD